MKVNLEEFLVGEVTCVPHRRRIEYTDFHSPRAVTGLFLEVRRASPGTGTWFLRFKRNGKTAYHRIGSWPTVSLGETRRTAERLKFDIAEGKLPTNAKHENNCMPTFKEFLYSSYIPAAKVRKRSWRRDEQINRLRLSPLADTPLDQLTRRQISDLHIGLREKGYAAATCNHALKVVRQTLNLAVSYEVLSKSPASGISLFPENNVVDRFLTPDELERLLKVLKTDKNRNICRIALLALATGARAGEILQCQYSQIDLEKQVWKIPSQSTKGNRTRIVPLNDAALEVITSLDTRGKYDHLFINPKTEKPYRYIHKVWERLRAEAGLEKCRFHDLRHCFGALLAGQNVSLWTISKLLGHAQSRTSERYAGVSPVTLMNASNSAGKIIQEAMKKSV
jgi:integrase